MANPAPGESPPPPSNPRFGAIWWDQSGEMLAWDGTEWVLYEDLPPAPDGDNADPFGIIRDY